MSEGLTVIETMLRDRRSELLQAWVEAQLAVAGVRTDLLSKDELRVESERFLTVLAGAVAAGSAEADLSGSQWEPVKDFLSELSRTRWRCVTSRTETASFPPVPVGTTQPPCSAAPSSRRRNGERASGRKRPCARVASTERKSRALTSGASSLRGRKRG